jgi:hypothetical protein
MKGVARMLLLLPMLLALGVALLRGGSPRALAALPLRGGGFFLAALAVQVALYLPLLRASALAAHAGGALYAGSLALALVGALRNAALGPALWVATLGLALNTVVIVANGGHMPVSAAAMRAVRGTATVREIADARAFSNARLAGPATRLTPLSDVIPVRLAGGVGNVYSVGDLLLAAGGAALVYTATRRRAPAGGGDGDGLRPAR